MTTASANMPKRAADQLPAIVEKYWGYTSLRPMQLEAMTAAVERRDALVVLPTGGGKSLCYQAPALLSDKPTVVLSPLIALMKDQVDPLIQRGIAAAYLNSSLDPDDRRRVCDGIRRGEYRLIFVAPERFSSPGFFELLGQSGVGAFAIDEAHCISHWGHDFRAEYRQLGQLKQRCPDVPVQAFTATATPRVRDDIIAQLGLSEPAVLVGDFFRPNLVYRVQRRGSGFGDAVDAVRQRPGQAGIVYCIRRADVDALTATLNSEGIATAGYHAGMSDEERPRIQDAFAAGHVNVIVATVAFGMGIDRADIRFVIHAAMPKSLEQYQQETGRAGRDGKPAECLLFYSGGDFGLWKSIIDNTEAANRDEQIRILGHMYRYCTATGCRHRKLVTYLGQAWDRASCEACDFCIEGAVPLPDSTVIAQKILSCVVRTGQRFGAGHVADVLTGNVTPRVSERGDEKLSTFNLLGDQPKPVVMQWVDQLVDQDLLARDPDYRTLSLTPHGGAVLHSEADANLYEVAHSGKGKQRRRERATATPTAPRAAGFSPRGDPHTTPRQRREERPSPVAPPRPLDSDEQELFEQLRALRRRIADEMSVPAFVVFGDKALRAMAQARPTTEREMLAVWGVGPAKYEAFGEQFLEVIRESAS